MNEIIVLFGLFLVKHFVCDFILQGPYQYENKGKLGHPGGLLHAGINVFGSWTILASWFIVFNETVETPAIKILASVLVMEYFIHYFMDFTKVRLNKHFGWGPDTHAEFWILMGFDQMVHYLTYVAMVLVLMNGWF